MAASLTTFSTTGDGDWVTINGPWSIMRSGGGGNVVLEARATGTADTFPLGPVLAGSGILAGASVGFGVVDVRFRCLQYGGEPIRCQVVQ